MNTNKSKELESVKKLFEEIQLALNSFDVDDPSLQEQTDIFTKKVL
jgi:hypothetical protein